MLAHFKWMAESSKRKYLVGSECSPPNAECAFRYIIVQGVEGESLAME